MKILMVCLGNICRSPLAEGILKAKAQEAGLNWYIDSAGTGAHQPGCSPHHLSQKVATLNGIDICAQKCRQLTRKDFDDFDKIYVMDDENYYDVKYIAGTRRDLSKVEYLMNEAFPGQNRNVPDPWFGGEDGFHKVFEMISKACDAVIARYHHKQNV